MGTQPVWHMLLVSGGMALAIACGKIVISVLSAYAVVFFRFPFRHTAFWLIFITLMLPVEVRIIPTYAVMADFGLINSFTGLTVPLIASATATLLFRQVFVAIPDELVEAARMDGAGTAALPARHPAAGVGAPTSPRCSSSCSSMAGTSICGRCWSPPTRGSTPSSSASSR